MAGLASKRLMKELNGIQARGCPDGIALLAADDMRQWTFTISVLGESLYQGETFALRFKFGDRYPIESPEVTFVSDDTYQPPVHPHVYSNGHICASIIGDEWSPVLNCTAICITMQSMLASNKKLERPEGNDRYVRHAPSNPKNTRWQYDDDTV